MSNPTVLVPEIQISTSVIGSRRAPIVAATIGNMFECFDIYIFGLWRVQSPDCIFLQRMMPCHCCYSSVLSV
ncbi:MAG: hypothetical protein LBE54_06840 [Brucellaceae bacterium]|jgi:hypothetical protein|nr:hypothetical protein [Brucellaceae bacterium]